MDKELDKIKKLLNLAKKNTSASEMLAALDKARKLAFKIGVDIKDIKANENVKKEVRKQRFRIKNKLTKKIAPYVIEQILQNFPIDYYYCGIYATEVDLMIYNDSHIDSEDIIFILQTIINYIGHQKNKQIYLYKKKGLSTKNVYNSYCTGFADAVDINFSQQTEEWGLIVCPSDEVVEECEKATEDMSSVSSSITLELPEQAYRNGERDGESYGRGVYNTGIEEKENNENIWKSGARERRIK